MHLFCSLSFVDRCPEEVETAVTEAVKASLSYKIQKQCRVEVMGEKLTELKIR